MRTRNKFILSVILTPLLIYPIDSLEKAGMLIVLVLAGTFGSNMQFRRLRVTRKVNQKYSQMGDTYRRRIIDAVIEGASIDDFSIEDGWLKMGDGPTAKYSMPDGSWESIHL
ncbi:hypothetical protein [Pseudomonas sp. PLMAX]|uniref:hypothetical protein n=1 Tax=Pseudomonas sp. PLMAX TaxID=2201998 RepID=UPI0038BD498D